jgi:acyl-CoA dehydrogenase
MAATDLNLSLSEKVKPVHERVARMVREEIIPLDDEYLDEVGRDGDRWGFTARQTEIIEGLKAKARERGLWNFWLTDAEQGPGLSTVDYGYLAEEMGRALLASEVFNCAPPDTGNMDILLRYGSAEHKEEWLDPLLAGAIRSAYLMSEPGVASSDATQIAMKTERLGGQGDYLLNGEKWWVAGAGHPQCKVYMVMARTGEDENPYRRHSMFLVPADTKGIEKLRAQTVYGHDNAPHGYFHLRFRDVRVPAANLILGEGRGFELAQLRLGPGRIHHGMRAVGQAERALELLCQRSLSRDAFGRKLAELGGNFDIIAQCRAEIEMARLLCLKTAAIIDAHANQGGDARAAAPWISMCIDVAPKVALKVVDEAIQMFGGEGVSQDTPLARSWARLRTLRLVDGPDAVHRRQVARAELRKYTDERI